MEKTKVICFANNKGGSAKTTSCACVGHALSVYCNKKVLLIDGDMQMNLTLSFFDEDKAVDVAKSDKNIYTAVKKGVPVTECIYKTQYGNIDIIPSTTLMSSIEYDLFKVDKNELVLYNILETVRRDGGYDYILIDSPPTIGGWVINILHASDYVVIPVEASPWGLFGLANLFDFICESNEKGAKTEILGIAVTKADERKNYFKQTLSTLDELEDIRVFETRIRVDSTVEWAQDNSMPVTAYKKSSRASKEYISLAKEIDKLCQ